MQTTTLRTLNMTLWALMLAVTGTYIRIRPNDLPPRLDWLVTAELVVALMMGTIGLRRILEHREVGIGSVTLIWFGFCALISASASNYQVSVLGYGVLLCGVVLFTVGMMQNARDPSWLRAAERTWLWVVSVMILKDSITSLCSRGDGDSLFRLGWGVTHPVTLSLMACVAFFLTIGQKFPAPHAALTVVRCAYVAVMLMSRSRITLFCFAAAAIATYCMKVKTGDWKVSIPRIGLWIGLGFVVIATVVGTYLWSDRTDNSSDLIAYITRGQSAAEVESLTGRTDIWRVGAGRVCDSVKTFAVGHGYGVSRLVLLEQGAGLDHEASHMHNTFLEFTLDMGLLGGVVYAALCIVAVQWLLRWRMLCLIYGRDVVIRAINVVVIILISSLTESDLASKVGPLTLITFVYIAALDRARATYPIGEHQCKWSYSKSHPV